jgi:hypothetical protein
MLHFEAYWKAFLKLLLHIARPSYPAFSYTFPSGPLVLAHCRCATMEQQKFCWIFTLSEMLSCFYKTKDFAEIKCYFLLFSPSYIIFLQLQEHKDIWFRSLTPLLTTHRSWCLICLLGLSNLFDCKNNS